MDETDESGGGPGNPGGDTEKSSDSKLRDAVELAKREEMRTQAASQQTPNMKAASFPIPSGIHRAEMSA